MTKAKLFRRAGLFSAIFLGILFTLLNTQVPMVVDDYVYSRSFVGVHSQDEDQDPDGLLRSLADVWDSQAVHYEVVNGRFAAHSIVQVFCGMVGKAPFDWLQGAAFTALLLLCSILVRRGDRFSGSIPLLLFLALCRNPAVFYSGVAQGVGYLWGIVLCLSAALLFTSRRMPNTFYYVVPLAALAFLAGGWHDAISIPVFLGLLSVALAFRREMRPAHWFFLAAFAAGVAVLVAAPPNWVRLAAGDSPATGFIRHHMLPLPGLRLSLAAAVYAAILLRGKRAGLRSASPLVLFSATSMLAGMAMSVAIGGENPRQSFYAEFMGAVLLSRGIAGWAAVRLRCATVAATSVLALALMAITVFNSPYTERHKAIEAAIISSESGDCVVCVPPLKEYPTQLQKYVVANLSDFQLYQWKWIYKKRSVSIKECPAD